MGIPLNIDWQQILLHAWNLVILTGGLYVLLYKPVSAFVEKREAYYADMQAKAENTQREAEERLHLADTKIAGMQAEIEQLRADAMKKAEAEAAGRLADAEKEKQALLTRAKMQAEHEKEKLLREANEQIGALVEDAVDRLISSPDDPYADFLHAVKRGA